MKNYCTLIPFLFCFCHFASAQYRGDQIFDDSYIHEIQITTDQTLAALSDMYFNEFGTGNYTYSVSNVTIDGISLDSIGVRVKGGLSAFDNKKPLKLDFNEFVAGRKYDGLKKLNLHQGNMDPSFMRETLAYGLMRDAGVKTVRTSFAKIYFNGSYQGIYTLIEQVNDDFIHDHFASADGALYKTRFGALDLDYAIDDSFTYTDFETAINQIPVDLLHEQLPEYMDVEAAIRFFITQIFLNAVDGPLTSDNNYYIYFEPKSATYIYIPWDYNLALYGGVNYTILQDESNFIFEKIKQNPTLTDRYLATFCRLLQYNFDENRLLNLIDSYRDLLATEVLNDPYIGEIGDFDASVIALKNVISSRIQSLTEEMNNDFTPCIPLVNTVEPLDLVINEIVASNDSTSNITDPAGGAADWIELYNNTPNDISLNGFYLSNDADLLKHWKLPTDLIIPANDYLIIWADRDVSEEGLHADFKLNKSLGDLYLSFDNGAIIDFVNYEDQTTNIGLARSPNGTGPFIMQATTFNATNTPTVSTENLSTETELAVFPNPTKGNTTLKVNSTHRSSKLVRVVNLQGQTLWQTELQVPQGANIITIPSSQFEPGMYALLLIDKETNDRKIQKLVVLD